MEIKCLIYGIEIPNSDWEKTPASVKELVEKLGQGIKQSEQRLGQSQQELADLVAENRLSCRKNQHNIKEFIISTIF